MMEPRPLEKKQLKQWKKKSKKRLSRFVSKVRRVSPNKNRHSNGTAAETEEELTMDTSQQNKSKKMHSILAPAEDYSIYNSNNRNNKKNKSNSKQRSTSSNNGVSSSDDDEEEELLSIQDFIVNFRENVSEKLSKVYSATYPIQESYNSGVLVTPLCEDVFTLINLQIDVLHYYIVSADLFETETGDMILIDNLSFLFKNLWYKQRQYRLMIGGDDLEGMCAKANDFFRMSERMEDIVMTLQERYPHLSWDDDTSNETTPTTTTTTTTTTITVSNTRMKEMNIPQQINNLLSLFSTDSVDAAQYIHVYVFRVVNESNIQSELFSREWEETLTHNEIALSLVATLEDFMADVCNFLCNDFLYIKAIESCVKATICFYVRCLVQKADSVRHHHRRRNTSTDCFLPFKLADRALTRIMYDVRVLQTYFGGLAKEFVSLQRVVEHELSILVTIHECMSIATGKTSDESLEQFILVLHKRTGCNSYVTKCLIQDLWFLMIQTPTSSSSNTQLMDKVLSKKMKLMKEELDLLSNNMQKAQLDIVGSSSLSNKSSSSSHDDGRMTGLKLDETLSEIYDQRLFQQHNPCAPIMKALEQHSKPMMKALLQHTTDFNNSSSCCNDNSNNSNKSNSRSEGRNDEETQPRQKQQQRWDSTNLPWENEEEWMLIKQSKQQQQQQLSFDWENFDHKEHLKNIQDNLLGLLKLHNLKRWKPKKYSRVEI